MICFKRVLCKNFRNDTYVLVTPKSCNSRKYSSLYLTDLSKTLILTRKLHNFQNFNHKTSHLLSKETKLSFHQETLSLTSGFTIGSNKSKVGSIISLPFRTSFQPAYRKKVNLKHIMAEKEDWMTLGNIMVYPWSTSGLDTCVTVKMEDKLQVAFDMGYPYREATRCQNVFISHGHIDHVSGLVQHASRRELYSMKPATYHIPPHLASGIRTVAQGFMDMHENMDSLKDIRLHPVEVGDTIHLPNNWMAKAFPTKHRVRSQGYILYKVKKHLRDDFKGLPGKEIAQLVRDGVVVQDIEEIPMVAYTGDTTFEVYQELFNPDLLKVKLLITEATYIDDDFDSQGRNNVQKARDRGHSHLREFVDNSWLFRDVENILLIHFSDKYSVDYIHETVDNALPSFLRAKIHLGTLAKEKFG